MYVDQCKDISDKLLECVYSVHILTESLFSQQHTTVLHEMRRVDNKVLKI